MTTPIYPPALRRKPEGMRRRQINLKLSLPDRLIFLFISSSAVILFNFWLFGFPYFGSLWHFSITTITALLATVLIWFNLMKAMFILRRRFPSLQDTARRAFFSLIIYSCITMGIVLGLLVIYELYGFYDFHFTNRIFTEVTLTCLATNLLYLGSYEVIYSFQKWKESLQLKEELEKERVQNELNTLKSQVNPHFLFNSLSSLSALIEDDTAQAEQFLNEMSKVYRYLLRGNSQELTSLSSEIQFLNSYYYLLKTRYGEGLEIHIQVDDQFGNYFIVPLALQMVVDNALKTNSTLKDQPLSINISVQNEQLKIIHSLQQKELRIDTDKRDLHDIGINCKLITAYEVQLIEHENELEILIPLVKHVENVYQNPPTSHS